MRIRGRTLGIAFSDGDRTSRIAGAVVRADGALDGLAFGSCTVGGTDATDALIDLFGDLAREDVRRMICSGIAPAWFNVIDLRRLHAELERPVLSVSYETSPGLEPALRREFEGEELAVRLEAYDGLPPRRRVDDEADRGSEADGESEADRGHPLFVRAAGIDDERAAEVVRGLVADGFRRPEPVRVGAIAASAHRAAIEG